MLIVLEVAWPFSRLAPRVSPIPGHPHPAVRGRRSSRRRGARAIPFRRASGGCPLSPTLSTMPFSASSSEGRASFRIGDLLRSPKTDSSTGWPRGTMTWKAWAAPRRVCARWRLALAEVQVVMIATRDQTHSDDAQPAKAGPWVPRDSARSRRPSRPSAADFHHDAGKALGSSLGVEGEGAGLGPDRPYRSVGQDDAVFEGDGFSFFYDLEI